MRFAFSSGIPQKQLRIACTGGDTRKPKHFLQPKKRWPRKTTNVQTLDISHTGNITDAVKPVDSQVIVLYFAVMERLMH